MLPGNSLNGTILPDHASSGRGPKLRERFLLFVPPPFWYKGPISRGSGERM